MSEEIVDDAAGLFRAVHPQYSPNGVVLFGAFQPTEADHGKLSVDQEKYSTARDSFLRRIALGRRVDHVCRVTVGQVAVAASSCNALAPVIDDRGETPALLAHGYIDMTDCTKPQVQAIRSLLALCAERAFPPIAQAIEEVEMRSSGLELSAGAVAEPSP